MVWQHCKNSGYISPSCHHTINFTEPIVAFSSLVALKSVVFIPQSLFSSLYSPCAGPYHVFPLLLKEFGTVHHTNDVIVESEGLCCFKNIICGAFIMVVTTHDTIVHVF